MCFIKHTKSTPPKKAIKELITYIMASFLSDIHKDANFQHTKLEVTHGVVSMVKPRWIVQWCLKRFSSRLHMTLECLLGYQTFGQLLGASQCLSTLKGRANKELTCSRAMWWWIYDGQLMGAGDGCCSMARHEVTKCLDLSRGLTRSSGAGGGGGGYTNFGIISEMMRIQQRRRSSLREMIMAWIETMTRWSS
jgi:hypothetical protein